MVLYYFYQLKSYKFWIIIHNFINNTFNNLIKLYNNNVLAITYIFYVFDLFINLQYNKTKLTELFISLVVSIQFILKIHLSKKLN